MSDNSIIPITEEQAKAAQEALKALRGFGDFLRETFGRTPQDLVGLLGGDWLKVRRAENIARIVQKSRDRLKARGADGAEPASLSVTLPILVAAADESREELQDIWARLLAAAADPSRARTFRIAFIEAAKMMDPLDAAVLPAVRSLRGGTGEERANTLADDLRASRDEIDVSISHLHELGMLRDNAVVAFGREFLRAVSD